MKLNQVKATLGPRIRQSEFAESVEVVPRTLRNWKKRTRLEDFPKLGRPAHDERAHRLAFWQVGREWIRQGKCGWRPISAALKGAVPDRLIQQYVKLFKTCGKRHTARRIEKARERVEVVARNALWVQDGTQIGRTVAGEKIETQVVKDRGPLVTVGLATGGPADSSDVIELLEKLKQTRGLPLVWGTDNGSSYVSVALQEYLDRENVIHLRSLPRRPEHNGSAEVGIGELKRGAGLQAASQMSPRVAHARIVQAAQRINWNRVRVSKELKTGAELDETLPESYHRVERDRFYRECRESMEKAQQRMTSSRERRMAEREAIFSTMERYGLVRRYRGGSQATTKAEIFS